MNRIYARFRVRYALVGVDRKEWNKLYCPQREICLGQVLHRCKFKKMLKHIRLGLGYEVRGRL